MLKNSRTDIRHSSRNVGHKRYEAKKYLHPFSRIWLGATPRKFSNPRAIGRKGSHNPATNILSKRQISPSPKVLEIGSRKMEPDRGTYVVVMQEYGLVLSSVFRFVMSF
jgi:hypothetical protein